MSLRIGTCVSVFDKTGELFKEMILLDTKIFRNIKTLTFQSVDKWGNMRIEDIEQETFNLLNWIESPIPKFCKIDSLIEVFEKYNMHGELDFKGATAIFESYLDNGTPAFDSIALYFMCEDTVIEIIGYGRISKYEKHKITNVFLDENKKIPYVYLNDTKQKNELHLLRKNNRKYFYTPLDIGELSMEDIACWSGEDYLKSFDEIENLSMQNDFTLESYGIACKAFVQDAFLTMFGLNHVNVFIITDHENAESRKYIDRGIIVNRDYFTSVNENEFINNIYI